MILIFSLVAWITPDSAAADEGVALHQPGETLSARAQLDVGATQLRGPAARSAGVVG